MMISLALTSKISTTLQNMWRSKQEGEREES